MGRYWAVTGPFLGRYWAVTGPFLGRFERKNAHIHGEAPYWGCHRDYIFAAISGSSATHIALIFELTQCATDRSLCDAELGGERVEGLAECAISRMVESVEHTERGRP